MSALLHVLISTLLLFNSSTGQAPHLIMFLTRGRDVIPTSAHYKHSHNSQTHLKLCSELEAHVAAVHNLHGCGMFACYRESQASAFKLQGIGCSNAG